MRDKNIVSFRGSWRERKFKNTNKKNKREQRKCYFILKRATGETRRPMGARRMYFAALPLVDAFEFRDSAAVRRGVQQN